jgi:hypothetical protein
MLVDKLVNLQPIQVACGAYTTVVLTIKGEAYSWGDGQELSLVDFEAYYKPRIVQVSCGGQHSAYVDDTGRLFTQGQNDHG